MQSQYNLFLLCICFFYNLCVVNSQKRKYYLNLDIRDCHINNLNKNILNDFEEKYSSQYLIFVVTFETVNVNKQGKLSFQPQSSFSWSIVRM